MLQYCMWANSMINWLQDINQMCWPADSKMLITACDDMHSHLYDVENSSLVEAFSGEEHPNAAVLTLEITTCTLWFGPTANAGHCTCWSVYSCQLLGLALQVMSLGS